MPVKYSIIIPVYNSADSLKELNERLTDVLASIAADYEIILVDDASDDGSWTVMEHLHASDPRIKIVQHMRNFGQHRAVLSGMNESSGEFIITMDDDLQHPPEEIMHLIEAIQSEEQADVVIGAYQVKQHSWIRNLGTKIIHRFTSSIFHIDRGLQLTSFRIIRRCVVTELVSIHTPRPRIGHMILAVTNRIKNIPVRHESRRQGKSGYTPRRLVSDALDNILSNSSLPLQVVSYLGFGCSILSVILAIYYLYRYFFVGISITGWTTTIMLILFFSGVMLFSFGMVGEYLIRILRELRENPHSIIRKKVGL